MLSCLCSFLLILQWTDGRGRYTMCAVTSHYVFSKHGGLCLKRARLHHRNTEMCKSVQRFKITMSHSYYLEIYHYYITWKCLVFCYRKLSANVWTTPEGCIHLGYVCRKRSYNWKCVEMSCPRSISGIWLAKCSASIPGSSKCLCFLINLVIMMRIRFPFILPEIKTIVTVKVCWWLYKSPIMSK